MDYTGQMLDMLTAKLKALPPRAEGESDEDRAALIAQAKGEVRDHFATIEAAEAAEAARWDAFYTFNVEYLAAADGVDAAIQAVRGALEACSAAANVALEACSAAAQAFPGKSLPKPYQSGALATSIRDVIAKAVPQDIRTPAADPGESVGKLIRGKASEIANLRNLAIAKAATAATAAS